MTRPETTQVERRRPTGLGPVRLSLPSPVPEGPEVVDQVVNGIGVEAVKARAVCRPIEREEYA